MLLFTFCMCHSTLHISLFTLHFTFSMCHFGKNNISIQSTHGPRSKTELCCSLHFALYILHVVALCLKVDNGVAVQCTEVLCSLQSAHCKVFTVHSVQCTVLTAAECSLHSVQCRVRSAPMGVGAHMAAIESHLAMERRAGDYHRHHQPHHLHLHQFHHLRHQQLQKSK